MSVLRRQGYWCALLLAVLPLAQGAAPPSAPPSTSIQPPKLRFTGVADVYGKPIGEIVPDYFGMSLSRLITSVGGLDVGIPVSPLELRNSAGGVVQSRYVWQAAPTSLARYTQPNCAGNPIIEDRAYVELDAVRVTMVYQTLLQPAVLLIAPPSPAQQMQVQSQGDPMLAGSCANVSFTVMARAMERSVSWPYKELYPIRLP